MKNISTCRLLSPLLFVKLKNMKTDIFGTVWLKIKLVDTRCQGDESHEAVAALGNPYHSDVNRRCERLSFVNWEGGESIFQSFNII